MIFILKYEKPSLMIVDGMAVLFRAYYATAVHGHFMYNSKGVPTNGLHGFIKHFMTAIFSFEPSHVAVCWDMGSETFRTELFPQYKANRKAPPEELVPQFEMAKEVVTAFSIPNIGISGYEADDCIGTIATREQNNASISILTGDRDMLQLLDEDISVIFMKKGYGNYEFHTKMSFIKENGIEPYQMIDVKAFMGDTSDNYPGVRGIGEKTALKLIKQFNHVDGVLENINTLTNFKKTRISENIEMLHLSRRLAKIKRDVPLNFSLDQASFNFNYDEVYNRLAKIDIRGLDRLLTVKTV